MNRKFHHKAITFAIKATMISAVLYGIIGGVYFALTQGIRDFGIYM